MSEPLLPEIGFLLVKLIPQPFDIKFKGILQCLVSKIVDGIMIFVKPFVVEDVVKRINEKLNLGKIMLSLVNLRFVGLNILQNDD